MTKRWWHWHIPWSVLATVIMLPLAMGSLLLADRVSINTGKIERLERQHVRDQAKINRTQDMALGAARQAEYRICVRQQVVRAVFNIDQRQDWHRHDRARSLTLAIYDCHPDLDGEPARRLTAAQMRTFEHFVATGRNVP